MEKKITIYSNDSSYGGISFISKHIYANILLKKSVRKDFDSMISNKIFYDTDKLTFLNIIKNTDYLIIFGVVSLKFLVNNLKINISRIDKVSLIITDTTFIKEYKIWNKFIIDNKLDVLIMPDLIKYLDKKITYRPYFQHIDISNIKLQNKNKKIIISHSPGLKYKLDLKGTSKIIKILSNYNLDIIYNELWENCLIRKSKSHIFIDQLISSNYGGGLGKSGLESMLVNTLTLTSGKQPITEPFFPNPPIIIINENNLKETVDFYLKNENELNKKIKEQNQWAAKYTSSDFVKNNILNGYFI